MIDLLIACAIAYVAIGAVLCVLLLLLAHADGERLEGGWRLVRACAAVVLAWPIVAVLSWMRKDDP